MKKNSTLFRFLILSMLFVPLLQACQEDDELFVDKTSGVPGTGSRLEQTQDSLFLYAKQIYLWNEALPEYKKFNPRKYTSYQDELSNLEHELFDITQFQINPATGEPYEFVSYSANFPKYSYIEEKEGGSSDSRGSRSSFLGDEETYHDFGFGLATRSAIDIRLNYVQPNSPAAHAGLSRGDRLVKINGRNAQAATESDVDYINSALENPSISLSIEKSNGAVVNLDLAQATYQVNPVMKRIIFDRGGKKIGYLVYDSFTRLSNSENELDAAFAEFRSAGVTDLIVDFRYNGGGFVRTAEYLINLIAPSRLNGSVMYTELYNEMMQNGEADILKEQLLLDENDQPQKFNGRNATYADLDFSKEGNTYKFQKEGSLDNIENVVFIVGEGTASASELVINSLKPYLNVSLVGQQTYGKPVGFFGINIDSYKIYMPNFKTINSKGEGEYYSGFEPDIPAEDDLTRDFGDPREESLEFTLSYLEAGLLIPGGRMSSRNARTSRTGGMQETERVKMGGHSFKGMVEDRLNLKR